jgi:mediator of RNA polymerase II transcription subunit 14
LVGHWFWVTGSKCTGQPSLRCFLKIIILKFNFLLRELSALDPKAELGYRFVISSDPSDPAQPLGVTHQPPLSTEETSQTCEGLRNNQLEKILVHTVYLRSKNRLSDLKKDIELFLNIESTLQGSPPILSVPILSHCLK